MNKNQSRLRRAKSTRMRIRKLAVPALSVHRSSQHLYAQVLTPVGGRVLAAASTLQKEVRGSSTAVNNKTGASAVGKAIAERALKAGVERVAFDRSGFKFHGRIKALADAAREAGLKF